MIGVFGIIYKATFPNGKVYIGQTRQTLERRKENHLRYFKKKKENKNNYVFYRAINKYGFDNITWETIDYAKDQKELNEKECYWIDYYKSYIKFENCQGYNMTLGGQGEAKFGTLNDKQLREFGIECKEGKSNKYLKEKYNLKDREFRNLVNGKNWGYYTKIPLTEWCEGKGTIFNRFQVCKIVKDFKKHGDVFLLAKELECSANPIRRILKGEVWSNFTGILNSDFFYRYTKYIGQFTREEITDILSLKKEGKTNKEIAQLFNVLESAIQRITSGASLSNFTNVQYKSREEQIRDGTITSGKLSKKQVEEIYKLLQEKKLTVYNIASKFNVSTEVIYNIKNGRTWKEITNQKYISKEDKKKERPITSSITLEQVQEIVKIYKETKKTPKEISQLTNVNPHIISSIITGRTWGTYTGIEFNPKKDIKTNGKTISTNQIDTMIDMYYNQNKNCKEIQDILNIDRKVIWSIVVGKTRSAYTGIVYEKKRKSK